MKTKTFILILLILPCIVLAEASGTDTGAGTGAASGNYEGFEGAAQAMGDFFTDVWTFLDEDLPNFFKRAVAYIIEKIMLMLITIQFESMKLAWSIAESILENFQIASKIASAASGLPQDIKAALVDLRFFDALNIIIQALVARYVMRFI
ncbi:MULTISPECIES: DUF2523 family protein [unclassified Pseudoalteromonas]|uniref:DUF2523 family protein n=1 Tax=unclassified Pseudoalteromonas TaxID=194690 RepID=UPI0025B624E9|nr:MULTISPECIES: DUF2523 family protein [unclassified Pseudoalteromonas]MDN3380980.1 DUF2523 family protein [Pseudoalteromonas sp. APC 3893]MDN3386157.1 DUF2523 family protein [Pseudoalteromonas sp. APC 4017]